MAKHVFILLIFLCILSSCVHHKSQQAYIGKNPHDPEALMARQHDRPPGNNIIDGVAYAAAAVTTAGLASELTQECRDNCELSIKFECAEDIESPIRIPFRHGKIKVQKITRDQLSEGRFYETDQDGNIYLGRHQISEESPEDLLITAGAKEMRQKISKYKNSILLAYSECKIGR